MKKARHKMNKESYVLSLAYTSEKKFIHLFELSKKYTLFLILFKKVTSLGIFHLILEANMLFFIHIHFWL